MTNSVLMSIYSDQTTILHENHGCHRSFPSCLIFLVFGLNGFLHFISMPPPSGIAGQFMGALFVSNYLVVVFLLQIIAAVLLLIDRYVHSR